MSQSAAKRFKITATGKVLSRRGGKQHLNEKKSAKTKHNLGRTVEVAVANLKNVIGCLPHAGITVRNARNRY